MAIVLDNTLAGVTSNSYADVAYCDDYWGAHFSLAKAMQWAALNDDQKASVLVQACRVIETARFTNFVPISEYTLHYDHLTGQVLDITLTREPVRYYYYQKLQFPRNLDIEPTVQSLYIPEPVMMAQCEQALYLMNYDETAVANRLQGVVNDTISLGRGQVHMSQQYANEGSAFAPMALEFIRPYLVKGARMRRA